jgi:hypothetical protein
LVEQYPRVPAVSHDRGSRLGQLLPDRHSWRSAADLRRVLWRAACRDLWDEARAALPVAKAYEAQVRRVERASGLPAAEAAQE